MRVITLICFLFLVNNIYAESELRTNTSNTNIRKKNYICPFLQVLGINFTMGLTANYLLHEEYARISFESIEKNIYGGFKWDDDHFLVNQIGHPYQGGLYHSAARYYGLSYWESIPYTIFGSLHWEVMMETQAPAINDLITTSLSGLMFGEVMWRLSHLVLNDSTSGIERFFRELGAGMINPMNGFNRLFHGDSFKSGEKINTPGFHGYFAAGASYEVVHDYVNERIIHNLFRLQAQYGDAFNKKIHIKPFDYFAFDILLKMSKPDLIVNCTISGLLYKKQFNLFGSKNNFFGIFQNFDFYGKRIEALAELEEQNDPSVNSKDFYFLQNSAYKIGATSIGGGFFSKYRFFSLCTLKTFVQFIGIPLGGLNSVYAIEADRFYNLGPGWGMKIFSRLFIGKYVQLFFLLNNFHITSLSGGNGQENAKITSTGVLIPLIYNFNLGVEMMFYRRLGEYPDLPDTTQENDAFQSFISLSF